MVRFYSPEWIAAFNDAVSDLDSTTVDVGGSVSASTGRFTMIQQVEGAPEGTLAVALSVADGHVSMHEVQPGDPSPQVTVSLTYDDAVALSRGELDAARMLATGRVKVRGDLAVLVAAQAVLAAAAGRVADLAASTTY